MNIQEGNAKVVRKGRDRRGAFVILDLPDGSRVKSYVVRNPASEGRNIRTARSRVRTIKDPITGEPREVRVLPQEAPEPTHPRGGDFKSGRPPAPPNLGRAMDMTPAEIRKAQAIAALRPGAFDSGTVRGRRPHSMTQVDLPGGSSTRPSLDALAQDNLHAQTRGGEARPNAKPKPPRSKRDREFRENMILKITMGEPLTTRQKQALAAKGGLEWLGLDKRNTPPLPGMEGVSMRAMDVQNSSGIVHGGMANDPGHPLPPNKKRKKEKR